MKQLSSFMALNIDGGDRISYTYNDIDEKTGEPVSKNNKKNFYVMDSELAAHIEAIRQYVRDNKLQEE